MNDEDRLIEEREYLRRNATFEELLGRYMRVSSSLDKLSEENKKLKHDLQYKDGTKMFETLMKNTEGEARELLARHCYYNLKCVLLGEKSFRDMGTSNLPASPIDVASMLISAEYTRNKSDMGKALYKAFGE